MRPPDRVFVEGIGFYAHHGLREDERRDGRRYTVDLWVEQDLSAAGVSDNLSDTVDYAALAELVVAVGTGPRRDLLESLAAAMADAILARHPRAAVTVRLRKHAPRLAGGPPVAGVEIHRSLTGSPAPPRSPGA